MTLRLFNQTHNFYLYGHTDVFYWLSEILAATEDKLDYRPAFLPTSVIVRLPDGKLYSLIMKGEINATSREVVMRTLKSMHYADRAISSVGNITIDEEKCFLDIVF